MLTKRMMISRLKSSFHVWTDGSCCGAHWRSDSDGIPVKWMMMIDDGDDVDWVNYVVSDGGVAAAVAVLLCSPSYGSHCYC